MKPFDLELWIRYMNEEADMMLAERRARLGPHRHGWWRGKPNPYAVGSPNPNPSDY